MDTPGSPPYYPERVMLTVELPDNLDDDDFEWPDHAPEPPPTPPPLPIMVTSESCIPKELKDDAFYDAIYERILRHARAYSIESAQASLYEPVPDEYINWFAFVLPWVCRVRGCPRYGDDFEERSELAAHCQSNLHETITQEPVQIDNDEDDGYDKILEWVRFDPPPKLSPEEEAAERSAHVAGSWSWGAWGNENNWGGCGEGNNWANWDLVSLPVLQEPVLHEDIKNDIEEPEKVTENGINEDTEVVIGGGIGKDAWKGIKEGHGGSEMADISGKASSRTVHSEGDSCAGHGH